MFAELVDSNFAFLEAEYRFDCRILNEREVQYELDDRYIRLSHTPLNEVSLSVGILSRGPEQRFDAGALMALTDPDGAFRQHDRRTLDSGEINAELQKYADLLQTSGRRVLEGDPSVFDEMDDLVEKYWTYREDAQTREQAKTAFSAKDYPEALRLYESLGDRRTAIDTKRMGICQKNL